MENFLANFVLTFKGMLTENLTLKTQEELGLNDYFYSLAVEKYNEFYNFKQQEHQQNNYDPVEVEEEQDVETHKYRIFDTNIDNAIIKYKYEDGLSWKEIANKLNEFTAQQLKNRLYFIIRKINLSLKLNLKAKDVTIEIWNEYLNFIKTNNTIKNKILQTSEKRKYNDDIDDKIIRYRYKDKLSLQEVADKVGIHKSQVNDRILDLIKSSKKLLNIDINTKTMSIEIWERYLTTKNSDCSSKEALEAFIDDEDIKHLFMRYSIWNIESDLYLIRNRNFGNTFPEIAKHLNTSVLSVQNRYYYLNKIIDNLSDTTYIQCIKNTNNANKHFSIDEDREIISLRYQGYTFKHISNIVNRSYKSVYSRYNIIINDIRNILGYSSSYRTIKPNDYEKLIDYIYNSRTEYFKVSYSRFYARWSRTEDLALLDILNNGCSHIEAAKKLGRTVQAIGLRLDALRDILHNFNKELELNEENYKKYLTDVIVDFK